MNGKNMADDLGSYYRCFVELLQMLCSAFTDAL